MFAEGDIAARWFGWKLSSYNTGVMSLDTPSFCTKSSLGDLLVKMEKNRGLPSTLKIAFSKLYGYASGPSGARHGPLVTEGMEKVDFDLAKFMLVACSAFINFAATLEERHKVTQPPL